MSSAQASALSDEQIQRGQQALGAARLLVNPSAGILGVSMGKSSDHPGEAAVSSTWRERSRQCSGLRGGRAHAGDSGQRARGRVRHGAAGERRRRRSAAISGAALNQALTIKQQVARGLMAKNPAFFGVGVGQSLDNPREPALVIYVDRTRIPRSLPATISGLRTRYVIMDRLHVTRSYATTVPVFPALPSGHRGSQ